MGSDNDLMNFTPIFNGASRIIENTEEVAVLCSHLPKKYLESNISLRFSIYKTGFESQQFVNSYAEICGPSILLIETYKKRVIGVFLDRSIEEAEDIEASDSCLFVLRPDPCVYPHQKGHKLCATVDLQNGFLVQDEKR